MRLMSLKISTYFILTATFLIVTSALTVSQNVLNLINYWGESLQMNIYLNAKADQDSVNKIQQLLKSDERVEKIEYISSEAALKEFKEQLNIYASDVVNEKELISSIPRSFQITMSQRWGPKEQAENMAHIADFFKNDPVIEEVQYGQEWVKTFESFFVLIQSIGLIVLSIIVLSSFFIISNLVRASIQSKQSEIEILELVGATQSYIRRPFIIDAVLFCSVASATALTFSYLLFSFVQTSLSAQLPFYNLSQTISFLRWEVATFIVVVAALSGWFAAHLCLRKINNGWLASEASIGANS
jgi:cell division transport system permease protein